MASRILGMGDVLSLIEDATSNFDKNEAERMAHKLQKNSFDLEDLKNQMMQIKKLGPLKSIISKLPGMDRQLKNVDIDDRIIDRTCAMVLSMTLEERQNPNIIDASRKRRIAKGSGMKVEDLNKLLKQFEEMRKMMKRFGSKFGRGIGKFRFPKFF